MALEIRRSIPHAHGGAILCVAYNPYARHIFTGGQDSLIKCWQSESGELVRSLSEHAGWVTGLAFANEIRSLFSCGIDGQLIAWSAKGDVVDTQRAGGKDASAGEARRSQSGPLHCLAWDSRRQRLLVGGNGSIWVYAFSTSDGSEYSGGKRSLQLLGELRDERGRAPHSSRGMAEPVRGIVIDEMGKVFTVGYDRALRVWDSARTEGPPAAAVDEPRGKPARRPPPSAESLMANLYSSTGCHDGAISAVTSDPDNNWLITGGFDRTIRVWSGDAKRVSELHGFGDTLTGLAYAPATRALWASANSPQPFIYDPRTLSDVTKYHLPEAASPAQLERTAMHRIQRLFTLWDTGEVLASTNTRQLLIWRFNPHGAASILHAHTDWVEALAYAHKPAERGEHGDEVGQDSLELISAGSDAVIRRWEPASRHNPALFDHTTSDAGAVECFVTCGDDSTIRLWPEAGPTAAPRQPQVLTEHTDRVTGLALVGASTLASVSWDLTLRLWQLDAAFDTGAAAGATHASTHVIQNAHDDYILSVAFSPELGQIASSSADQGVKLWDVRCDTDSSPVDADGEMCVPEGKRGKRCCGVLLGHTSDVSCVKWSEPLALWVTSSEDRTVRLWNRGGVQVGEYRPPGDGITALALDRCHGCVIVGTMDAAVRIYAVAPDLSGESLWPFELKLVQTNSGHADAVRCVLHVPERQLYVTASWDRSIRVWRAYSPRTGNGAECADAADLGDAQAEEHDDGSDRQQTYAELHPLTEPKWLRKGGALERRRGEGGLRARRKIKPAEMDDATSKASSALGLKLLELETRLKATFTEPAAKPAPVRRARTSGEAGSMRRAASGREPSSRSVL